MTKMILVITNKNDITVDFIIKELKEKQVDYYRLNTEDIPQHIRINFDFNNHLFALEDSIKNISIDLKEITAVYFRRPELSELCHIKGLSSEEKTYLKIEMAYVLEGIYKILDSCYWINNVYRIREAENKIYQLLLAQCVGFKIPESIISNSSKSFLSMIDKYQYDCIIKPVKTGKLSLYNSSSVIFTSKIRKNSFDNSERVNLFPVYLQEHIHKKYDLRCIVVGEKVYCAQIESQAYEDSKIDWRKGKKLLKHNIYHLPPLIEEKCIQITKKLELKYSAIDLILDENGDYIFLECNPNGQWAWLETRLGFPISKHIVHLLCEGE